MTYPLHLILQLVSYLLQKSFSCDSLLIHLVSQDGASFLQLIGQLLPYLFHLGCQIHPYLISFSRQRLSYLFFFAKQLISYRFKFILQLASYLFDFLVLPQFQLVFRFV